MHSAVKLERADMSSPRWRAELLPYPACQALRRSFSRPSCRRRSLSQSSQGQPQSSGLLRCARAPRLRVQKRSRLTTSKGLHRSFLNSLPT